MRSYLIALVPDFQANARYRKVSHKLTTIKGRLERPFCCKYLTEIIENML